MASYIYPMSGQPVPMLDRYQLGGPSDLRGYDFQDIGPKFSILRSPGGGRTLIDKGGDKELLFQLEYFMPLIQEAGIKALVFADAGRCMTTRRSLARAPCTRILDLGLDGLRLSRLFDLSGLTRWRMARQEIPNLFLLRLLGLSL